MCFYLLDAAKAWLPPGWALLGGLFAVMRLALFSYWIDSYWGGAVAAIGGALVLGNPFREDHAQREDPQRILAWHSALVILAGSRLPV